MIIKKDLPTEGEFVLVKITKIMPHGAYCRLAEYDIDAYLPIAEVASGWIKNIHEFVREGQQDVAKVIFVEKEKRTVDVSLKKTTTKEKKDKIDESNTEKRAEGIFNKAVITAKKEEAKATMLQKIVKKVTTYSELITEVSEGKDPLAGLVDDDFKQIFYEAVAKNIKPKTYTVSYNVEMTTTDHKSGIKMIKEIFQKVQGLGVEVLYLGAPHYRIMSTDSSYLKAEERIKEAQKIFAKYVKQATFDVKAIKQ